MHGWIYGMYFVSLMLRYKINTVDIHFIFSALDKQSVQVIVDIFFEFLKILFFNTSETIVNILEIQNLWDIKVEIFERTDDLQRVQYFCMLGLKSGLFFFQASESVLNRPDSFDGLFDIHQFRAYLRRIFQLFIEAVDRRKSLFVRVNLQKRWQIGNFRKLGESIFQMYLIFGKISFGHSVNVCLGPGDA